jgi:hypothetical protein
LVKTGKVMHEGVNGISSEKINLPAKSGLFFLLS